MTGAAVVGLLTLGALTACFLAARSLARSLAQQLGPHAIARFVDEINVRARRADAIAERAAQRLLHRRTHAEPPAPAHPRTSRHPAQT